MPESIWYTGHSAHHPLPIEIYRGRLVLYGCGDRIDDYEGVAGYEQYRDDLRLLYLPSLDATTGELTALPIAPMQAMQLRLRPPAAPTPSGCATCSPRSATDSYASAPTGYWTYAADRPIWPGYRSY